MMPRTCDHGYRYVYQCPTCSKEPVDVGPQRPPVVRPRNRAERRKLDSFLRRNGMRP